ncbi:MAG: hypothetical protein QXI33_00815 [Candidatus Pacearchaeota archaeon]
MKTKSLKSKTGLVLSGIYLTLSIISIIYSRVCNAGICDVGYLILPSIPWIAILSDGMFRSTFIGLFVYVVSILINAVIFYLIGYFIGYLIVLNKKSKGGKKAK